MKKLSLRIRLILSFLFMAAAVWIIAGVTAWFEIKEEMDEFFDTYQVSLAKQFATADWAHIENDFHIINFMEKQRDYGEEDDEALGFAVFTKSGKMLFNDGRHGRLFKYSRQPEGFSKERVNKTNWRIFWLASKDNDFIIAVGQELEFREDLAFDTVSKLFIPWIVGFIFLSIAAVWLVNKEFAPLRVVAKNLSKRKPTDFSPIPLDRQAQEIKPLIQSMNDLFGRIEKMIEQERNFVSNSAHELRTPLTALKVQLEVAFLAGNDEALRTEALNNLKKGIDWSTRLITQLLTLSRLETLSSDALEKEEIDWKVITEEALSEQSEMINQKNMVITTQIGPAGPVKQGNVLLLALSLRNLLDNAVKYGSPSSEIKVELNTHLLRVTNVGSFVEEKYLNQLGERFFRPVGQKQGGSGLGLSIVGHIARIHNCTVRLENTKEGFAVELIAQ